MQSPKYGDVIKTKINSKNKNSGAKIGRIFLGRINIGHASRVVW